MKVCRPEIGLLGKFLSYNYDQFFVKGQTALVPDEAYTSHNTAQLDVPGVVERIKATSYVQRCLAGQL